MKGCHAKDAASEYTETHHLQNHRRRLGHEESADNRQQQVEVHQQTQRSASLCRAAMRKRRRPKTRKRTTCRSTDAVAATKSPPRIGSSRSRFINKHNAPSPVPMAREPVSPI